MVAKILNFRLSENLKMPSTGYFALQNYALHSRETLLNIHLPNITIGISITVYLIPQYFSWLKNYKWQ